MMHLIKEQKYWQSEHQSSLTLQRSLKQVLLTRHSYLHMRIQVFLGFFLVYGIYSFMDEVKVSNLNMQFLKFFEKQQLLSFCSLLGLLLVTESAYIP